MNIKNSSTSTMEKKDKKMIMRGFMCQSPAATAVCMSRADARSVMVPRRSSTSSLNNNFDINFNRTHHTRSLLNSNKYYYSRLLTSPPPPHHVHDHGKISPLLIMPSTSKQVGADHHHDLLPLTHKQPMSSKTIKKRPSSHSDSVLPSSADDNVFQVVVMRVSIHCQGCAGKVKKHLSKMEGVTSFSIDLETKMVTVRGHVSPSAVMESISKVKKAELLPS
ncbi:unnamed protein product [Prunus armeniaca]|uniref:HMA domain-containing protein n=1 Tax=Prunus armeniaca TaxID=36596 RepID=A0A6J5TU56_PRUAR|nr:unnamed protein product [Prunus armeniaca]